MKTIIVAIDFSKCSLHALDYAILIANQMNANIKMVWVDNQSSADMIFSAEEQEERQEKKAYFEKILVSHGGKLNDGILDYKLRKGKVFIEISNQAKHENAFLIVAGTHGVSGYEEYWIGSNTYRIVTNAPCPVLAIRHDFDFSNLIQKIIFPLDSSKDSSSKLEFSAMLAKAFNAQLLILSIYPQTITALKRKVDQETEKVVQYLEENKVKFAAESIKSDDITRSIINYANMQMADLIAIMTEQGITNSRVFLGPNARQIINNSNIPVLNIRPNL